MHTWAHVMSSFRGQWLPGDARGFRDHGHRIHSSGDYRNPPPPTEHSGLRAFAKSIPDDPITLTIGQRVLVGGWMLQKLVAMSIKIEAIACDATHAHVLLHAGDHDAKDIMGRAKQFASHGVREMLPGKLWGASSGVVRIKNDGHFIATRDYILRHAHDGAWVWKAGDPDPGWWLADPRPT